MYRCIIHTKCSPYSVFLYIIIYYSIHGIHSFIAQLYHQLKLINFICQSFHCLSLFFPFFFCKKRKDTVVLSFPQKLQCLTHFIHNSLASLCVRFIPHLISKLFNFFSFHTYYMFSLCKIVFCSVFLKIHSILFCIHWINI